MIPLKWVVVVAVTVGTLLSPVVSEVPSNCDWLTPSESSGCIQKAECKEKGDAIYVFENCTIGQELFTITDGTSFDGDCPYASGTKTVTLKEKLDAEDLKTKSCPVVGRPTFFFSPVNINEFPPEPTKDTAPVTEVRVAENLKSFTAPPIYYKDDDYGETTGLSCEQISGDENLFSLESVDDGDKDIKAFSFTVNGELDYESQVFYRAEYNIISTDGQGNTMNATQTFFVYVQDEADNPPFFTKIVAIYNLEECSTEDNLFEVAAQDRDVDVMYDIKYSMTEDGGSNIHFAIDENTGEVSKIKNIDREELLENSISTFSLEITATEYKPDGTPGEEPNYEKQVTTVVILDCNDNEPEFNNGSYEITMNELTQDSGSVKLNLEITVSDMDKGTNGSYTLTTNDTDNLSINPVSGEQSTEITLTALWISSEDNYFDYEKHRDTPLEFTITATEDANKKHTTTVNVTITLTDLNDCSPVFDQPSYTADVNETSPKDFTVLTVAATDDDVSEEIGTPSIRYILGSSCSSQLNINEVSGEVTLKRPLNYEDGETNIQCTVNAKDSFGNNGNMASSDIIITVIDEVDEPPEMEEKTKDLEVEENSTGKVVDHIYVNDLDNDADIKFFIVSQECTGDIKEGSIDGWFDVLDDNLVEPPKYSAVVTVSGVPDRETCNQVTLTIMAVDVNTVDGADNDTATVTIAITDVKDTDPKFVGEYNDLRIDEFDEQNPPSEANAPIFTLIVEDPDEGDTIQLSVSKGQDKVTLTPSEVHVDSGQTAEVQVMTKNYADINREEDETIEIEITLTNPDPEGTHAGTRTQKHFSIKIRDLNDKVPIITSELCNENFTLAEDYNGTASINNTNIFNITAKDDDAGDPYNVVGYYLLNTQNPDSKDQRTPFKVDETTGEVTVFLTEENTLDRERDQEWELNFRARDHCPAGGVDTQCQVLSSDYCKITIIVQDVNDNPPRDLTWIPNEDTLTVDDFLKNGTELGYTMTAEDDDFGENATLTYEVLGTYSTDPSDGEDKDLFYAKSDSSTCRLYAKKDFEGQQLTGSYNIIIQAKDGGNLTTDFNVALKVVDGNDQAPKFTMKGCAGETATNIITMQEGDYKPGVNGPNPMTVQCKEPGGLDFIITLTDADKDDKNKAMEVMIDLANSTVEEAEHGNPEEQLKYWSLSRKTCSRDCDLQLQLSHEIDREKGSAYNLYLHAINTAEPLQESWTMVRVAVTNKREFEPLFCTEANCTSVVYMEENEPMVEAFFVEATDNDNMNTEDPAETVFYFIRGGDINYFQLYSATSTKILLQNLPHGLDREDTPSYSLDILATNDQTGQNEPFNSSSILHLTIMVRDQNDVTPSFKTDVIFTSFQETDKIDNRLTEIEADDLDLNETLTYTMLDDVQWHDTVVSPPETSFILEVKDNRSVYLKLAFDPNAVTQGYCNFTIHVVDAGSHETSAQVKVYSINDDFKVPVLFSNPLDYVREKKDEIEAAFTDNYKYRSVIDSIVSTEGSGDGLKNETTVTMHFINDEKNKPVEKDEILKLSNNADIWGQLYKDLKAYGLILDSIGQYSPPDSGKSPEDQILTLKILLAVVSLVLGCLLVLLITVSCIRTKSLQRKVKVLSTNTFGSKESGLNHMGHDVVPGSNLAQVHGNHNPVFSEDGAFEMKIQDTGSISSGDSDLIGIEDNPEFKGYSGKTTQNSSSKGYENPSFGRSIDQVSAPVPGVQGGVKGNPLLNLGGSESPRPSTTSLERQVFGEAGDSDGDAASVDQKINSNFSFL